MPVDQAVSTVYLGDFSEKDKPWDKHRSEADGYRDLYEGTRFQRHSDRIAQCGQELDFGFEIAETGEAKLRLQAAHFCRCRHCPVCQWRRSLMWKVRFLQAMPEVMKAHPKARYVFLTLTVRNCELHKLKATLTLMNDAWQRLIQRKAWPAIGWVRVVEVTRGADDTAHPHFHAMLMVKPSYFTHGYIPQQRWTEQWQTCLRVDYTPIVNVKAIKPLRGTPEGQMDAAMGAAIKETLKYSVKPGTVLADKSGIDGMTCEELLVNRRWLVELTTQLYKTRAITTGGVLKAHLAALLEEDPDDLIHAEDLEEGDDAQDDKPLVRFNWTENAKRYAMRSEDT